MSNSRPPYMMDRALLPIIKECLDSNMHTSIDSLTEHLMTEYPRFSERKVNPFRQSVAKVVKHLLEADQEAKRKKKKKNAKKVAEITINEDDFPPNATTTPRISDEDFFEIDITGDRVVNGEQNMSLDDKPSIQLIPSVTSNPASLTETPKSAVLIKAARTSVLSTARTPVLSTVRTPVLSTPRTPVSSVKRKVEAETSTDTVLKADFKKICQGLYSHISNQETSLSALAGLEYVREEINLLLTEVKQDSKPVCVLVSGVAGSGKTVLMKAVAQEASLSFTQINLNRIMRSSALTMEKKLQEELFEGISKGGAMVLISQTESLWTDGSSSRQSDRESITEFLHNLLTGLSSPCTMFSRSSVVVALECCHPDLMDLRLRNSFHTHIALKPPTAVQRQQMLEKMLTDYKVSSSEEVSKMALKCSGFVARDLEQLVKRAYRNANRRRSKQDIKAFNGHTDQTLIIEEDFLKAYQFALPSLKEGFPSVPDKTWDNVGGLTDIREVLRKKIVDPIMFPDFMTKFNKQSSGVLLWGPPGCGKTLLAKAVANEAGINLLIVNGPEVLSMYQGESERTVRLIFARAASVAPCVIFFDEFDSLCPQRSKNDSGSKSTIVNTLLTEMNGFLERKGLFFMAATNLPSVLDTAVLRPGRFDTLLYVGLPDAEARVAVFKAATKNGTHPALASDVDFSILSSLTANYSGADCHNLVDTASTECWDEMKTWRKAKSNYNFEMENCTPNGKTENTTSNNKNPDHNGENPVPDSENPVPDSENPVPDSENPVVNSENPVPDSEIPVPDRKNPVPEVENPFPEGEFKLYMRHFHLALQKVRPSVSREELRKYESLRENFSMKTLVK